MATPYLGALSRSLCSSICIRFSGERLIECLWYHQGYLISNRLGDFRRAVTRRQPSLQHTFMSFHLRGVGFCQSHAHLIRLLVALFSPQDVPLSGWFRFPACAEAKVKPLLGSGRVKGDSEGGGAT